MAIELTHEQLTRTVENLRGNEESLPSPLVPPIPTHEYELNQSESLTFLYNLLFDESSHLSKADILSILNSLKLREDNLPFYFNNADTHTDTQGVHWPEGLKQKFVQDRIRIGNSFESTSTGWYFNIPSSRETVRNMYKSSSDFYNFHKFFSKLKLHITHFQLRNLVCCGSDISKGIYYPSAYIHDNHLQTVTANGEDMDPEGSQSYFKINRLAPDTTSIEGTRLKEPMKLDCLVDSRSLTYNSNSRISTLACSNNYLTFGTFEGGYVLVDTSKSDQTHVLGEYNLASKVDGITNHIIINEDDKELVISSNDKFLRIVDINQDSLRSGPKVKSMHELPFAINCLALNKNNVNEKLITGDDINSYIIDTRLSQQGNKFAATLRGHEDFGFSCDWSPTNENLMITGNQDGSVKLWDRRKLDDGCTSCWDSSFGRNIGLKPSKTVQGAPVRNTKFSFNGEYIAWAESLDHIGIVPVSDVLASQENTVSNVQSIDFVGKCMGLNFAPSDSGYGEELIIGVNDCPLGGILSYKLESVNKSLDFDFFF